ncbi:PQQ-binding-like beta-propeller repeat protein [Aureivirga sp. CE67]|uniref:outer membrane protein assembly factor BamB family protein n=1 Tax=Aureivirga sp. CE67 TaxID=1788983 RepID=UPI0018C9F6DD|nr:PQQ-binding-like beta-propeller repeat protein [Aureivirga sp. CE67]
MKINKVFEFKLKGKRNISSRKPLIIKDKLYVLFLFEEKSYFRSKLICLYINNFDIIWEYDYSFIMNDIMKSVDNNILICTMDGKLKVLNSDNGELLNTFDLELNRIGGSSNIYDEKIVFGGVQGTRYTNCFNLISQKIEWVYETGGHSYTPLIKNENVYLCSENKIRCFKLNSGKLVWEAFEKNSYIFNPIVMGEMIAVGGHGLVNIYDSNDGELLHQIDPAGIRESIRAIRAENNILYFGDSAGIFYAYEIKKGKDLNLKSNKLWEYESGRSIESYPEIYGENILFINDDKKLICLNKYHGEMNWKFNTKGEAKISGIVIENQNIYLSVSKGYVYKLKIID